MYRLGDFLLDPEKAILRRDERIVHLPRKPYSLFVHLVENRHRLVPREELLDRFWDGQEVYDQNLSKAVGSIRKALGDPREGGLYLETRWGTGYRYVGPFEEVAAIPYPADAPPSARVELVPGYLNSSSANQPSASSARRPNPNKPRWQWLAAAVLALVVAAGLSIRTRSHASVAKVPVTAVNRETHVRRSIAVLGFDNLSGKPDSAWLSGALSEMFATEFEATGQLRTIPQENISRARTELKLAALNGLSQDSLAGLRKNLAADWIVTGGYTVLPNAPGPRRNQIRIDIRVQDAASSETVASVAETGTVANLFDLIGGASADLSQRLGLTAPSTAQAGMARAAIPSDPVAFRFYSDGVAKLRAMDAQAAIASLRQAVIAEPSFPLTHLALSEAWGSLGYEVDCQTEAKQARALSNHLSRQNQLQVEGHYYKSIHQWDQAIDSFRSLYIFFPDNIEYGLMLAEVQSSSGRPKEALQTIAAMRKLPPPQSEDPRLDLAESGAYQSLSDSNQATQASGRAAEQALLHGNRFLYARALSMQAGQFGASDVPRAIQLSDQARPICEELHDLSCVAAIHRRLAVFNVDSEPADAENEFRAALEIARRIGNRDEEDKDRTGLAALLSNEGRYEAADHIYRELLDQARKANTQWGIQEVLNNLGEDLIAEGRIPQAHKMEEEALAISQQIGLKGGSVYELLNLGQIQELEGDLTGAQERYRQAQDLSRQIGFSMGDALSVGGLGNILRTRGNLAEARKNHEEALRILQQGGDGAVTASERLALARLALDQNRAGDAEKLALQSADEYGKLKQPDNESRARAALAEAFVRQSKFQDAAAQIAKSESLISASESTLAILEVKIAANRVEASLPDNQNTLHLTRLESQLESIANNARTHQIVSLEMEARLAGRIIGIRTSRLASTRLNSTRESLSEFEKEARTKGFLLLAQYAAAAAG